MRAVAIAEPGRCEPVEIASPAAGEGSVLLRVHRLGLCGSDLSTYRGANPLVRYPRIPGHEIGATIAELGEGVTGFSVGQPVTVSPYTSCGRCTACRRGRTNTCRDNQTLGVQRDGALAPWLAVPADRLVAQPGLSLAELALVEPMSIGFHATARGRVESADTVAVLGCGMIGLGAVAGAAARGARVIAVDLDTAKLEVARAAGAGETLAADGELTSRLADLTDGDGPDVIIEAVGAPATYQTALAVASFAGRVVTIGYAKAPIALETKLIVQRELDVLGSRNALPADLSAAAAHLASGAFPVDRVITQVVGFDQAGAALARWADEPAGVIKIQIELA